MIPPSVPALARRLSILAIITFLCLSPLFGQDHTSHESSNLQALFSLFEIPFLLLCLIFAFLTASELKGGKFGRGMNLLAIGFLIMAIGHVHMQVEHLFNFSLFKTIFPAPFDMILWYVTLIVTWGFSGYGFYLIYKASSS